MKSINQYINEKLIVNNNTRQKFNLDYILQMTEHYFTKKFLDDDDQWEEEEQEKLEELEMLKAKQYNEIVKYCITFVIDMYEDNIESNENLDKYSKEIEDIIRNKLSELSNEYLKNYDLIFKRCEEWYDEVINKNCNKLPEDELAQERESLKERTNDKYKKLCIEYIQDNEDIDDISYGDVEYILSILAS